MEVGILAAIVILSVELVIIIVVIAYLFCFRRQNKAAPSVAVVDSKEKPVAIKTISVDIVKEDDPIIKKEAPTDTVSMGSSKSKSYNVTSDYVPDSPSSTGEVVEKSFEMKHEEEHTPVAAKEIVIEINNPPETETIPPKVEEEVIQNAEENNNKETVPKNEIIVMDVESSSSSSSEEEESDEEKVEELSESPKKITEELSDHDSGTNTLPPSTESSSPVQEHRTSSIDTGITLSLIINQLVSDSDEDSSSSESEESTSSDEDSAVSDPREITVTRWIEEAPRAAPKQQMSVPGQYQQQDVQQKPRREIKENVPGKDNLVVAGIINVTSGEKLTICQAVRKGLIPINTAKLLLEAQAATGGIIVPRTGAKLSVSEAVSRGIVEAKYQASLTSSEGAYYGYLDSEKGQNVSLNDAMQRGIFQRSKGLRLLVAQLATGGIIDPWTTKRYALKEALEKRLIDHKSARALQNPENITEFYDPHTGQALNYFLLQKSCIRDLDSGFKFLYVEEKTNAPNYHYQADLMIFQTALRKKISAKQLIDAGLLSSRALDSFSQKSISRQELQDKMKPILFGVDPIAGILGTSTKQIFSINKAFETGMLRRSEALGFLEAQVATGSIIDPKTTKKYTVKAAVKHGLVDRKFEEVLERTERAVYGTTDRGSLQALSIHKAMKLGSIVELEGIKLLEAQISTGGIIDPETGCRLSNNMALRKNLVDEQLLKILTRPPSDKKAFYDNANGKNVTYKELIGKSVMIQKKEMQIRLYPIEDGIRITTSTTSTNNHEKRNHSRSSSKGKGTRR